MDSNDIEQDNETVCDETQSLRTIFVSVGTCLSIIGCIFNGLLLYVFIRRARRLYPFQAFLAFLDFMLCALYIHSFAFLSLAVEWKIAFLYNFVLDTSVKSLVMSRIVQLAIPYTLIANSADKLAMIIGNNTARRDFFNIRIIVIAILTIASIILRINGCFILFVQEDTRCDFFHSKWLSQKEGVAMFWTTFENILTFFHTFVSFVVLCALNIVVVSKLSVEHRKARRQSTSPAQLFSTSTNRIKAAQEIREQQKRLRCAVRTTVVIISVYLACNCLNFVLYLMENFQRNWIVEENGAFKPFYVFISDVGSLLFVFSSTFRLIIYYKFNSDIRTHLLELDAIRFFINEKKQKNDVLLKVDL